MQYLGSRFTKAGRGIRAEWSYRYSHWACDIAEWVLSPFTIILITNYHDIRPFAPSPNRVHRVLSGSPAGFENTLLRGAWSRVDGGRRVAVGGADRIVTIWDVESSKTLYKVRFVIYFRLVLNIMPFWGGSCPGTRVPSQRWTSILKSRSVRNSLCRQPEADIS